MHICVLYIWSVIEISNNTNNNWCFGGLQVKMRDLIQDEVLNFRVDRWLSRQHEEDKDIFRELPVVRPGKQPLPGDS